LSCAAAEILEVLAQETGGKEFSSILLNENPELTAGGLRELRTKGWNCFKHATRQNGKPRDDAEYYAAFEDKDNDFILFAAWFDYAEVTGAMPVEAIVLQIWLIAQIETPENLHLAVGFEGIQQMDRKRKKEQLRRIITRARKRLQIMSAIGTERRALTTAVRY
jgi:hypothetical protein